MLKALLAAAVPLQRYLDKPSPTHGFINRQALTILAADGEQRAAAMLERYIENFNEGCDWADGGWRNVGHMYNPDTGRGLPGCPSAPQLLRAYWDSAVRFRAEWHLAEAFFYLGAAAHLVQDLCVPHHAAARLAGGHQAFEAYARRYRHRFAAHSGGLYCLARTPEGWVVANADYARRHYAHCITSVPEREHMHHAIADLLPRAQRSTAGFVAYFLRQGGAV